MPAKSAWLPRIGSILAELHVLKIDYLDRHAVERIFGVRQRRARQLMGGLPTLQIGNALAIPRCALITRRLLHTQPGILKDSRWRENCFTSTLASLLVAIFKCPLADLRLQVIITKWLL